MTQQLKEFYFSLRTNRQKAARIKALSSEFVALAADVPLALKAQGISGLGSAEGYLEHLPDASHAPSIAPSAPVDSPHHAATPESFSPDHQPCPKCGNSRQEDKSGKSKQSWLRRLFSPDESNDFLIPQLIDRYASRIDYASKTICLNTIQVRAVSAVGVIYFNDGTSITVPTETAREVIEHFRQFCPFDTTGAVK